MSPRSSVVYVCSNCDAQYPKWQGRCSTCGKFGTVATSPSAVYNTGNKITSAVAAATLVSLDSTFTKTVARFTSGLAEIDRVLGGGVASSGVILLTGEPGVGKSTLVLSLAEYCKLPVLYASGEESAEQVASRLSRLGLSGKNISFAADVNISALSAAVQQAKPKLLIIDSLQTMSVPEAGGATGSPTQIKAVLAELVQIAKNFSVAVLVVGHVTKEGLAAGPKTIEHLVDVVLSLEGDDKQQLRFLRAAKNRFGPTDEVGVFQMTEEGLQEVANPSALFLDQRHHGAGSCIAALLEGSRSLLIELQALVTHSRLVYPKRATTGFDFNRLQMLMAVLGERAGVKLNFSDVYINLAGGLRAREPALDLAVCAAITSATFKRPLPNDLVVFGEVGLGGEVRTVVGMEKRLQEAARLGFKQVLTAALATNVKIPASLAIASVKTIAEAVEWIR